MPDPLISGMVVLPPSDASTVNVQDTAFIAQIQESNLDEIAEAKIALANTTGIGSREFAHWMIGDHTGASAVVEQLGLQLGITVPTALSSEDQAELSQLSTLKGTAFDQAYAQSGVAGHAAAIAALQQEIASGQNPSLISLAKQLLPVIQAHYEQASILAGQSDPGPGPALTPTAQTPTAQPATLSTQDSQFVQQAATSGLQEITEGQVALTHTSNVGVSEYGRWMIADHTAMANALTTLGQQEGFAVPAALTNQQTASVQTLQGITNDATFAKTYADGQLVDHSQVLLSFITEALTGTDPGLISYAKSAIPTLVQHLVGAGELDANVRGVTLPQGDFSSVLTSALTSGNQTLANLGITLPSVIAPTSLIATTPGIGQVPPVTPNNDMMVMPKITV